MDQLFSPLFDFFASILNGIYSLIPNYGLVITLFTILLMVVTAPLTLKSTKSMLEMQKVQPQLKELQRKYKNDKERLNTELMALYKEHQISPLSGCLPVLAQAPVFIVMYRLMIGLTTRLGGVGSGVGWVSGLQSEGRGLTGWVLTDQPFAPKHLTESSRLYKDLSRSTSMKFLGLDLSISPGTALGRGFATFLPYVLLLVAILVIQLIQNRQIQARTQPSQTNPQQQWLLRIMPFILPLFAFNLPASLALYWGVQGLCRIALQGYITHKFYGEAADAARAGSKAGAIDTTAKVGAKAGSKAGSALSSGTGKAAGSGKGGGAAQSGSSAKGGGKPSASKGRKSGTTPPGSGKAGSGKAGSGKTGSGKKKAVGAKPGRPSGDRSAGVGRKSGDPRPPSR